MKFLAPIGGTTTAYGILSAPNHKGIPADIKAGKPWAGDVGCLQGPAYVKRIDVQKTLDWLVTMKPHKDRCLFVAGADIVEDAKATLEAYEEFERYFTSWPLAYVAQNGSEDLPFPTGFSALFVGGDTDWKCSMAAVSVIKRAQAVGAHIHIGRVNWGNRYRIFRVLDGADQFTCDGTRPRYDGVKKTLTAWHGYEAQPALITL